MHVFSSIIQVVLYLQALLEKVYYIPIWNCVDKVSYLATGSTVSMSIKYLCPFKLA